MYCSDDDNDDCTKLNTRTKTGIPFLNIFGIEELLYQYNVDLAVWAHEHDFERFWPVYNNTGKSYFIIFNRFSVSILW